MKICRGQHAHRLGIVWFTETLVRLVVEGNISRVQWLKNSEEYCSRPCSHISDLRYTAERPQKMSIGLLLGTLAPVPGGLIGVGGKGQDSQCNRFKGLHVGSSGKLKALSVDSGE